jgi:hypothetical protein
MDELSDEQSNYEEYQELIKALKIGAEKIDSAPGRYGIFGIQHISYVKACLVAPEPSGVFQRYHETAELPEDKRGMLLVWDEEVEYNGDKVMLRKLIERLELLWKEYRMFNEGGA